MYTIDHMDHRLRPPLSVVVVVVVASVDMFLRNTKLEEKRNHTWNWNHHYYGTVPFTTKFFYQREQEEEEEKWPSSFFIYYSKRLTERGWIMIIALAARQDARTAVFRLLKRRQRGRTTRGHEWISSRVAVVPYTFSTGTSALVLSSRPSSIES